MAHGIEPGGQFGAGERLDPDVLLDDPLAAGDDAGGQLAERAAEPDLGPPRHFRARAAGANPPGGVVVQGEAVEAARRDDRAEGQFGGAIRGQAGGAEAAGVDIAEIPQKASRAGGAGGDEGGEPGADLVAGTPHHDAVEFQLAGAAADGDVGRVVLDHQPVAGAETGLLDGWPARVAVQEFHGEPAGANSGPSTQRSSSFSSPSTSRD